METSLFKHINKGMYILSTAVTFGEFKKGILSLILM
jgi:hypothetical protein